MLHREIVPLLVGFRPARHARIDPVLQFQGQVAFHLVLVSPLVGQRPLLMAHNRRGKQRNQERDGIDIVVDDVASTNTKDVRMGLV